MKIGIVTHPLLHNYGGVLQAFALQEVLRRMGHSPVTIDFLPEIISKTHYILAQLKTLIYYLLLNRTRRFFPYSKHERLSEFKNFMDRYITLTDRVCKYKSSILKKYDIEALIAGSDQIWRFDYNSPSVLPDLYLRFAKNFHGPKIAYAASFGVDQWIYSEKATRKCSKYAKLFTAISTREDSGVRLCNKYYNIVATGVVDPTLLLSKEDYMALCDSIARQSEEYLFAYLLDMNSAQKETIEKFAKNNHLHVIFCTSERDITLSVEEWLAMFRDASFVITNSFHGTVFSIINNKNFYAILNEDRGGDRFISLLSRFHLEDRLIKPQDILPEKIKSVDWNLVNKTKSIWQHQGLDFLRSNLNKFSSN